MYVIKLRMSYDKESTEWQDANVFYRHESSGIYEHIVLPGFNSSIFSLCFTSIVFQSQITIFSTEEKSIYHYTFMFFCQFRVFCSKRTRPFQNGVYS